MEETAVSESLKPIIRYFNNRRPTIFTFMPSVVNIDPGVVTRFAILWHGIKCGEIWSSGCEVAIKSPHIKRKRRNKYGLDVYITSNRKKAVEAADCYIRVPTPEEIVRTACNVPTRISALVMQDVKDKYNEAREPLRSFISGKDLKELIELLLHGVSQVERSRMLKDYEACSEAEKVLTQSQRGWNVVHDKIDNVYYVNRSHCGTHTLASKVIELPEPLTDMMAVLRVCEEGKPSSVGAWAKRSDAMDVYYIYGGSVDGLNLGSEDKAKNQSNTK